MEKILKQFFCTLFTSEAVTPRTTGFTENLDLVLAMSLAFNNGHSFFQYPNP